MSKIKWWWWWWWLMTKNNRTFMSGKRSVITAAFRSPRRNRCRLTSVDWFLILCCKSSSTFAEPTRATALTCRLRNNTTIIVRTATTVAVFRNPALIIVYRSAIDFQSSARLSTIQMTLRPRANSFSTVVVAAIVGTNNLNLAYLVGLWHTSTSGKLFCGQLTATAFGWHASDA